ncbi:MAG: hypothetical protein JWQ28_690 [Pedobacter sp.]|nr:hypothetical protein [Pedobacter sp.]
MKRTTLIILMVMYLLSTVGFGVNRFYCCGKLAAVDLILASSNSEHQDSEKDNCCKNEKQSFKIKDNHVKVSSITLNQPLSVIMPSTFRYEAVVIAATLNSNAYHDSTPPLSSEIPIYTLNCTYRI